MKLYIILNERQSYIPYETQEDRGGGKKQPSVINKKVCPHDFLITMQFWRSLVSHSGPPNAHIPFGKARDTYIYIYIHIGWPRHARQYACCTLWGMCWSCLLGTYALVLGSKEPGPSQYPTWAIALNCVIFFHSEFEGPAVD